VAVYIREGIDLVLRQYGHLLPGQLPLASENVTAPSRAVATSTTPIATDRDEERSLPRAERGDRAERTAASASESAPDRPAATAAAAAAGAGGKS